MNSLFTQKETGNQKAKRPRKTDGRVKLFSESLTCVSLNDGECIHNKVLFVAVKR